MSSYPSTGGEAPVGELIDYSALAVGFGTVGGVLGGTYVQAVGANQTQETVQTSTSSLALATFVANTPKIGQRGANDQTRGIVIDPPRTQWLRRIRDASSTAPWAAGAGVTFTANYATSPDGASLSDRLQTAAPGNYGNYPTTAVIGATAATTSFWVRPTTSGQLVQWYMITNGAASVDLYTGTTWERRKLTIAGMDPSHYATLVPADCQTWSGAGSGLAKDNILDFVQLEPGKFATEVIPNDSTTLTVSRDTGYEYRSMLSYVSGIGQMRLRILLSPKGVADAYDIDGASIRLFTVQGGPSTCYAQINTTTRVLTIVHDATSISCAVPMTWQADEFLEIVIQMGGALETLVRYRMCAWTADRTVDSNWGRPFDPSGGASLATIGAISNVGTINVLTDGTASVLGSTLHLQETFVQVVPAWMLSELPTDDASVKAWYRPDGATLVAGSAAVSAIASQDSSGDSNKTVAQAFGPSRPTWLASYAGLNNRQAISYDGGDWLRSGTWTTPTSQPWTMYVVVKVTGSLAGSWLFVDSHTAAPRLALLSSGPNIIAYTTASIVSGPASSSATQVFCLIVNAASSATYRNSLTTATTGLLGNDGVNGNTLGADYTGGQTLLGVMGDVIIASGAHTLAQRTAIMGGLASWYGVTLS